MPKRIANPIMPTIIIFFITSHHIQNRVITQLPDSLNI